MFFSATLYKKNKKADKTDDQTGFKQTYKTYLENQNKDNCPL